MEEKQTNLDFEILAHGWLMARRPLAINKSLYASPRWREDEKPVFLLYRAEGPQDLLTQSSLFIPTYYSFDIQVVDGQELAHCQGHSGTLARSLFVGSHFRGPLI